MAAADNSTNVPRHSCCVEAAPPSSHLPGKSLYQLDARWTDDQGKAMPLASLKGRPQIVTMFFAHCQYACPLLVYKIKQVEAALPEEVRSNVCFTLVSFDSERDTPAALRTYRMQHELQGNWRLLHGGPDDVLNLAALLGVKFKQDAEGQFKHSNVITLLNAEGEIVYQEAGLNLATDELAHRIGQMVRH